VFRACGDKATKDKRRVSSLIYALLKPLKDGFVFALQLTKVLRKLLYWNAGSKA
jgi:hypothetical protein